MNKNFILSHNDLDGYGCIISGIKAFGDVRYLNVGYNSVIEKLNYISGIINEIDNIFVTDLSFGEPETIELYKLVKNNPRVKFVYVDHHPFDNERQKAIFEKCKEFNNFELVHTEKYSATYIFYKYLVKKGFIETDEKYDVLMKAINDLDTWNVEGEHFKLGLALNDVFFKSLKPNFMAELTKEFRISDKLKQDLKNIVHKKEEYFNDIDNKNLAQQSNGILILMADEFINHMTLRYPNNNFFINGRSYGGISVRVHKNVKNAKEAKLYLEEQLMTRPEVYSVGGHDYAYGVTLNDGHKHKYFEIVMLCAKALNDFTKNQLILN